MSIYVAPEFYDKYEIRGEMTRVIVNRGNEEWIVVGISVVYDMYINLNVCNISDFEAFIHLS